MSFYASYQAPPRATLPFCLAALFILPFLAVSISALHSLARHFGQTLSHFLGLLGIALAYVAQVAMGPGAFVCIYHSLGICSIDIDPRTPEIVALAFSRAVSVVLALGFLTLAVAGVYTFECAQRRNPQSLPLLRL